MTATGPRQDGRRVVITGCGVISPIGHSVEEFWAAAAAGTSGIRAITGFDESLLPTRFAGQITGFDPRAHMPNRVARRLDRFAQFALAATEEAVRQAALDLTDGLADRTAVLLGSGYGPGSLVQAAAFDLRERGRRRVNPYLATGGALDSAAGEIAVRFGARGMSGATATACATGTTCVGDAMRMIRHGYADVVIAGGADDAVNPLDLSAAANAGALSRRDDAPELVSRPFDRARDGFVMGAGAGVLVLEAEEVALARGATVLAEVAGYGATSDAYHSTHPHPEGAAACRAMTDALADAAVAAHDIDHISAHGTGTPLNDRIESAAIRAVLGEHARRVPISSLKSMTGHMIGAAGAVELIAAVQTLRTGVVPPTLNCDDPEDRDLDYVPHRARRHPTQVIMSNSFGFGGHNAVLVVRSRPSADAQAPGGQQA